MVNLTGQASDGVQGAPLDATSSKKKRSKTKSAAARGPGGMPKSRGTGFEENYADPPMGPDEYEEEQEIYAPEIPFHERIEQCIQRFRARRRLDNERGQFFTKYLLLGGIDSTPRMFSGVAGPNNLGDDEDRYTKSELRAMQANDLIFRSSTSSRFYSPDNSEDWDVDFNGVVAGYL